MTSAELQHLAATERALALMPTLVEIGLDKPLDYIAACLNQRGISTERGGRWHPTSVSRLLRRLGWPKGIEMHIGDCREVLPRLPGASVDCCITSPPYWRARDYGAAQQIGWEPDVDQYVGELVRAFAEVRRVLQDRGTLWLVIGDAYIDKNRCLIPARVALALQKDGWILRDEIVWHKSRATPAPVFDRTVAAHEFVYMFSKQPGYHYDFHAIEEPAKTAGATRSYQPGKQKNVGKVALAPGARPTTITVRETRRRRSVWSISPQPSTLEHLAMFPPDLAATCLRAGCRAGGIVLDPFAGAGTTGLAAIRHGRRACLIELNPSYAEMARDRLVRGTDRRRHQRGSP